MEQKNNTDKNTNKKKQITHKHTSPILRGFYNRYLTPSSQKILRSSSMFIIRILPDN